MPTTLTLLIFGENPDTHLLFFKFADSSQNNVLALKSEFTNVTSRQAQEYGFYKLDKRPEDVETIEFPLSENMLLSNVGDKLTKYWPNKPSADVINVLVVPLASNMTGQSSKAPNGFETREKLQPRTISYLEKGNSSGLLHAISDIAILSGRTSLPIGLYHPIFDAFRSFANGPRDDMIPPRLYPAVQQFVSCCSQAMYEKDDIRHVLHDVLGHHIFTVKMGGAKLDGVVLGNNGVNCMTIELDNEIGTGKPDPSTRGAISYAKYWGDKSYYYASLPPNYISASRFDPSVRWYRSGDQIVEFTYIEPLGEHGSLKMIFRARTIPSSERPAKDIVVKFTETYNARAHQLLSASGLAPKLLFDGSNFPEAPRPSGRFVIVMDYVRRGQCLTLAGDVPTSVRSSVQKAIEILHSNNIVFGDLRRPNVLAVEDVGGRVVGGILVDFDWCGTHGVSRYPIAMNKEAHWAEGVEAGGVLPGTKP
ncbi:hypothetical protein FRC09_005647 [Ceratobasidium sp. 395]|nr:hypothetical protein FRC09_005647 [Ceratobasidium sp. 395]